MSFQADKGEINFPVNGYRRLASVGIKSVWTTYTNPESEIFMEWKGDIMGEEGCWSQRGSLKALCTKV